MPRALPNGGDAALPASMRSVQMAMNNDKEEKAARLQSRQAQHLRQMDQLRAAATSPPNRKRRVSGRGVGGDDNDDDEPPTPSSRDDVAFDVRGDGITPTKRVPLLANFEEWMKLATDNKINANNSWNFALIDYFHDMSLLKEGDGVNFQKASCTLDGCVKIYTSRVDSVATETGKLLSGLADSRQKKRQGDDENEGDDDAEEGAEGGEDGGRKKKSRTKRSAETTLVSSFDQLRLKKMELEFSVDPLFKKASADFDEGGAKGLLLNHLSIDSSGRIVFDSSDDVEEEDDDDSRRDSMEPKSSEEDGDKKIQDNQETTTADIDIAVASLGARFFSNLDDLDALDICPSLKTFAIGSGDSSLDLPFLRAPENWRDEHEAADGTNDATSAPDYAGGDDDHGLGNWDATADVGFGEGGEAWARDAALQPLLRTQEHVSATGDDDDVGTFDANTSTYAITLQHNRSQDEHENILNYFDTANQKNWAGPEHWKIARVKDTQRAGAGEKTRVRKEKETFEIDFAAPMTAEMASILYTTASSNSVISLPKKEWRSRNRNLLPDDKHFNSRDLLTLFLKPKAMLGARKAKSTNAEQKLTTTNGEVDEAYWASAQYGGMTEEQIPEGGYDANFFADDNLRLGGDGLEDDDDIFADAHEMLLPDADAQQGALGPDGPGIDGVADGANGGQGAFGAHLVTQSRRLRPEYVQYARVAKKVDVRRLKEEFWRGSGLYCSEDNVTKNDQPPQVQPQPGDDDGCYRFTNIMNNLRHVYPKQQLADISTSYGFICLLHLANEKGLVVENVEGWQDLLVRKDPSVVSIE